jgi:polyhydroxyalkanoate synthase
MFCLVTKLYSQTSFLYRILEIFWIVNDSIYAQIAASYLNACVNGFHIMNTYNTVYLRAFERALEEERENAIHAVMGGSRGTVASNTLESIYNKWLKNVDNELERELKLDYFTTPLAKYAKAFVELRTNFRKVGYPVDVLDRFFDFYVRSHMVFSIIPKEYHLAPFDVIYRKGKTRLLHYRAAGKTDNNRIANISGRKEKHSDKSSSSNAEKHPLLMIYAPINTFHILDLNPRRSVVRNLVASETLDVYVLDWGYPSLDDNDLSLSDYFGYVTDAVKIIKDETGSDKVSILGYCWGGIVALAYAALFSDNVRTLTLMAVPVDLKKDTTILASWSRSIDTSGMMNEFGHMDGQMLDLVFLMRNPPRYGFDKYLKFFQMLYDVEFVDTFIDVERWLHDTPPIPGKLHQQIIDDCYRKNLLVENQMEITTPSDGVKHIIDLRKITAPLLIIVAEKDDLVHPESSIAVNNYVSSKDKRVLQNPGGHVALCISSTAHKKLWPEVAKWILSR